MESGGTDEVHRNDSNTTKITTVISIEDSDLSLSLSITPPSLGNDSKDEQTIARSEDSISEHLSSAATSIENDRSLNEIEIDNVLNITPGIENHDNIDFSSSAPQGELADENLNNLGDIKLFNIGQKEVKSILEEILNNEQFISDSESFSRKSKEDSFDIFANLDLEDRSLTERLINQVVDVSTGEDERLDNACKQVQDLEELLDIKDQTIIALTEELDSLREALSNPSTMSIGTSTDYKQLHEDYQNKFVEYNMALQQKDDLIMQLTESLQQSIANREELKTQVEHFKNELEHLQHQLETTSHMILKNDLSNKSLELDLVKKIEKGISLDLENTDFETECLKLEKSLGGNQLIILNNIKKTVNKYIDEKINNNLKENEQVLTQSQDTKQEDKETQEKEIVRLTNIIETMKNGNEKIVEIQQEIEIKHQKEMEDLRRYFEQKCTDLEKNYSEEIFSHQSRKRSASVTSSENEIPLDIQDLTNRPGPGGDAPSSLDMYRVDYKKRALQNLTKTDLMNLKADLNNIINIFQKFEVENSSEKDLTKLKDELSEYDVKNLFKIEMEAFRNEMKNKYNAELEILNQDYENKVDMLNVQQEEKLNSMREKYLEEIETLKDILNKTNKSLEYGTSVQEVGNSGDFEINEVIQSYERRLQEQITMAKIDIIAALENQIQRLAEDEDSEEEWPQELLTLKERFTRKFETKMSEQEKNHQEELARLKEDHIRNLNGALERARRRSLRDGDSLQLQDVKIIGERDNFKKQAGLLRKLLGELLKYFTQCEDEVNNTLVDELVRQATEKNLTDIERELNESTSSVRTDSSSSTTTPTVKRVHMAPNFKDLMSIVENSSEIDTASLEFSSDLRNELESCLDKLRAEANALLALSVDVSKKSETEGQKSETAVEDGTVGSLNRKLIEEVQLRMKLQEEADERKRVADIVEAERSVLEGQVVELIERLNVTQADLEKAQTKIAQLLESGQREIVSEGYGGARFEGGDGEGNAAVAFNKLQERARTILVGSQNHDASLLHLVEDLVSVGERILEEYNSAKKDLQQQIDVAHKKYKQTCKFLEEQAVEREMERDESQKQISELRDQLKNTDRDLANFANMNEEVDHLDSQLKETVNLLETKEQKLKEVEAEKDEAVEKIFFLRDVIRELESQLKTKTETEAELRTLISDLESVITQSGGTDREDSKPEDVNGSETCRYQEHIRELEKEVQQLRLGQELIGAEGALREVRNQLFEIEISIDKKTKELEDQTSILSITTCSSPSEDMSVRDVVRSKTPTSMMVNDCEIPLQQLARLKEKLVRHSRAEDAAMKRIRDLEMQVFALQSSNEEHKTERDILKKEIADQLVLISSLQIRLDDQRIRAEHIEKQTNSSLENKIYDLQKEINELQESLQLKNKTIINLNSVLEDMKRKIEDRDSESSMASEDEMVIIMQKEIEHLRNQNELLHKRLNTGVDIIPNLVENIISDKNSDIESLRQKLESAEKQLDLYSSLNLDQNQMSVLKSLKNSGTSLSEVLSIIEFSTPEQMRRMETNDNSDVMNFIRRKPMKNDTILQAEDAPEISSIENLAAANHYAPITPQGRKNSTEVKSAEKHVHFDLTHKNNDQTEVKYLIEELENLKKMLLEKEEVIKDCREKLDALKQVESNIDFVQSKLEETQHTLKDVEEEMHSKEEKEMELRMELVQKNMYLEEQERELNLLKDDSVRKDEMYLSLAKETKNLKKEKEILESEIADKERTIQILEQKIIEPRKTNEDDDLELRLKENEEQCESLKIRLETFSKENENKNKFIEKLKSDNDKLIKMVKLEAENGEKIRKNMDKERKESIHKFEDEIEMLKKEKEELNIKLQLNEKELDVLRGDLIKMDVLKKELENLKKVDTKELEKRVLKLQLENSSKIEEVDVLKDKLKIMNEEIGRFQDLLGEKDRIIARFKNDSEQLQTSLKIIQNKMQESGNVVDLGKKLRDEQMRNSDLIEEIQILKAQMMNCGISDKDVASLDEITGKMKKELDYSAEMDSNILSATEDIENVESKLESKYLELKEKCKEYQRINKLLKEELDNKKMEMDTLQLEDANLMEQLRIQLESATENEMELENVAETWKKQCEILEIQISKLKSQLSSSNSKSESTEYKNLPSKEVLESTRLQAEIKRLSGELELVREEVKALKRSKKEFENDLKYNKDMLEVKKREIERMRENIAEGVKREEVLKEKLTDCEEKFRQKVKEVENSRRLIDDMERNRKDMKIQMDALNSNLKELEQETKKIPIIPPSSQANVTTADQLMSKIEELNIAVKNDKQTMDLIIRLTNDNTNLKCKIMELEKQGNNNVTFENQVNRSNYLFAKCLRVESYRKALIWQKRYLVFLLGSYQYTTDLGPLEIFQRGQKKLRFSGIQKFRSSVYTIIAVVRMKSIVRRWHTGSRFAENINSRYTNISSVFQTTQSSGQAFEAGNFKVGHPVSRQLFSPSTRGSANVQMSSLGANSGDFSGRIFASSDSRFNNESGVDRRIDIPWSGDSPPCRDGSRSKTRISSNLTLLKAPQLLNQYAERYGKIEGNLEALLNPNSST